ncbi:hypothetical protein DYBT9275_01049 [Dyadobacter sp. CECT 9275]|uniref:HTH cro/C1-type domain-containing protein n=1 Tax=Dyadobacter helix TaxID=2822344 RepID=A0A916JBA2_9BACT|nr:helix-turn-helix transcriptional regulator [Dyadobacter sp. CECT 9275]CAG4992831.1 hypothetical protein DYBT9275_01049 [Dyadobacter sp. CECT 9275]
MNKEVIEKTKLVAGNIRKLREYREYTQEYMAMKLGISQNAYSKIELAYTRITLERMIQISIILNIDLVDLLKGNLEDTIVAKANKIK